MTVVVCRTGAAVTVLGVLGQWAETAGVVAAAPWPWWTVVASGLLLLAAGGWLISKRGREGE